MGLASGGYTETREGFRKRFELIPALDAELKDRVYQLRHQVYCEDLKFEPIRPDGRESDEYDAFSTHLLLRYLPTGEFIGCARLVTPPPDDALYPLPFERTCAATLDRTVIDPAKLDRRRIAEASRLAVASAYRRRRGEAFQPVPLSPEDFGVGARPRFPYILVGLYLGVVAIAHLKSIEKMFLLSEPRLADHFSRLGVEVLRIGGPVEHRGIRVPSVMDVERIVARLNAYSRPIYDEILHELERRLASSP
jgi:N-acyl amino acid synthase of PEP-CTERM/exosortase system